MGSLQDVIWKAGDRGKHGTPPFLSSGQKAFTSVLARGEPGRFRRDMWVTRWGQNSVAHLRNGKKLDAFDHACIRVLGIDIPQRQCGSLLRETAEHVDRTGLPLGDNAPPLKNHDKGHSTPLYSKNIGKYTTRLDLHLFSKIPSDH